MVFTTGRDVCVQTCWRHPWRLTCQKSRSYGKDRYCVDINCEHDRYNRFAGCHKGDGRAWHRPTCSECAKLFPKACGKQLERKDLVKKEAPSVEYMELQYYNPDNEANFEDIRDGRDGPGGDDGNSDSDQSDKSGQTSADKDSDKSKVGIFDMPDVNHEEIE